MGAFAWPSAHEISEIRKIIAEMSGESPEEIRVVVSPYRICPLGAHIDHQGGNVSAMTINKGILLGFTPSKGTEVVLRSGQFKGEVKFCVTCIHQLCDHMMCPILCVNEIHHPNQTVTVNDNPKVNNAAKSEEACWGNYARGAAYSLQSRGNHLVKGIIGYISGSEGLDSSGLSSSAAVGIAYLLALESANNLNVSPSENIEYDRLIENEYLGLRNGILDQSAILLSRYGCLTYMNCKTKEHKLVNPPQLLENHTTKFENEYKILLAFSGLKQNLTTNPGYNRRVAECQEAARTLLDASGNETLEPFLSNVQPAVYQAHKGILSTNLARRAEHFFSENMRVTKGLEAWASGNLKDFGKLISASGLSSIQNYECGAEPLIQLYQILLKAPGVFGARFSGAGFRGCCLAFVDAKHAQEAATFVREEYSKAQPQLASHMKNDKLVLICEQGDCAHVI